MSFRMYKERAEEFAISRVDDDKAGNREGLFPRGALDRIRPLPGEVVRLHILSLDLNRVHLG